MLTVASRRPPPQHRITKDSHVSQPFFIFTFEYKNASATWESSFCEFVTTSSHRFYPIQAFISNPHLSPILPALYKMELWARELAENGDSILYVDRRVREIIEQRYKRGIKVCVYIEY